MTHALTVDAERLMRMPSRLFVLLALAIGAPFLPPGPLALLASAFFVFSTSYRIATFVSPGQALERVALSMLLSFMQIAASAEFLSLFGVLNVASAWLAMQGLVWFMVHLRGTPGRHGVESVTACIGRWYRVAHRLPGLLRIALWLSALVLAGNFMVAALAGVTEYDSVTHYVPYVIDFCQQGSLAYPPHGTETLVPGMFARLPTTISSWHSVYVYTMVVTDSMVMLNLLGWLATVGAFLATLAICRTLHLRSTLSLVCVTATFCAPLFVAQAANTMYDQIQAFGFAMLVLSFLKTVHHHDSRWLSIYALAHVFLMGMKITWLFISPVLLILDVFVLVRCVKAGWRRETLIAAILCIVALGLLVIPHYARNLGCYGALFPDSGHGLPRSFGGSASVFLVRILKCLLPYEAHYVFRFLPGWPFPNAPLFIQHLLQHVHDPYRMASAYFGVLPAALLVLLAFVSVRFRSHPGRRRYLLWIAWCCFAGWILFQATFALAFKYTPWNGRYMLMFWPLAAVMFTACIQCLGGRMASILLIAISLTCTVEAMDIFLHRRHNAPHEILNLPRQDHFRRDLRFPKSNIAGARRFLDQRKAFDVYTDLTHFLRLEYYDAMRQRRIRYRKELAFDGTDALITNLSDQQLASPTIREAYDCYVVQWDVGTPPGRRRVVLVPADHPTTLRTGFRGLVTVEPRLQNRVVFTELISGKGMGGIEFLEGTFAHWLGPRQEGALNIILESSDEQWVHVTFRVLQAGIALPAEMPHPVEIRKGGVLMKTMNVSAPGRYIARIALHPGRNDLSFVMAQDASGQRYPVDPRPCMLYLSEIQILPSAE